MDREEKKKKSGLGALIIVLSLLMLIGGAILACMFFIIPVGLSIVGGILSVIGLILLLFYVINYNTLVSYKNKVEESLSLIDVHLKLRFDLIPNLVNTVKGYAKHEKELFAEITALRNKGIETKDEKEKIDVANKTLPKIRQIIAVAENYPELKSSALFKSLMDELILVEDKIVAARRFYDSNVNAYNTAIEVWPANIIANIYGYTRMEMFRIDAGEKMNISIDFKE